MATPEGSVALAVIVRGIDQPCDVGRVTEVLEWIVPLLGDNPGTARLDLRLTCPDPPGEIAAAAETLRRARNPLVRSVPGRTSRTIRLDLTDTDARAAFCLLAPWSEHAHISRKRHHVLAIADGTRSFWVELPKDKAEDLTKWFRRRALGKLVDMDTWTDPMAAAPRKPRSKRPRKR